MVDYDVPHSAGARQFHFPIYYDPTGQLYQSHAGLAIVNQSANTTASDEKWSYPGTQLCTVF
jgi:hypothetical protein